MVTPKSPLTDKAVLKVAAHASESGHFYDRNAQQILEVVGSKGQAVKPDLRHARKLQLCRGITSILALSAKPQLVLWQVRQGIMSALTLPRSDAETEKEWMDRVEADMKKTAQNAADEGSRIDAAISSHINGEPWDPAYKPHIDGALAALDMACGIQTWKAQVSVVSQFGYGTKIDMLSEDWCVNWKSKDEDQAGLDQIKTYDEHAMQLAAELVAAAGNINVVKSNLGRRAAIGFVSRTHPGASRIAEVPQEKLERGWTMFHALLQYSFAKDGYRPEWATS